MPYLGYVELNLMLPEEFLGKETEVPTLVLVVPDVNIVPQILIGTNSLDVLYSSCVERNDCRPQSFLPGYRVVLKILEVRKKTGRYWSSWAVQGAKQHPRNGASGQHSLCGRAGPYEWCSPG